MSRHLFYLSVAFLAFGIGVIIAFNFYLKTEEKFVTVDRNKEDENQNSVIAQVNNAPGNEIKNPALQQDIRSIDFKNFTYNWFPKYGKVIIKKKIST